MSELFVQAETPKQHKMRSPCRRCGCEFGYIETRGGQDCVFCADPSCRMHNYNAPKLETGREVRSTSTVHEAIKPKQRARILMRANSHCELCGAGNVALHVGHLLSVNRGLADGLTELELNSDDNLCAMCPQCNLGLGDEPVSLRLCIAILEARVRNGAA